CGDRRNSEIRGQAMSEQEEHQETEWLDKSRKGSNMTSNWDLVVYGDTLSIWMTIAKYRVLRVTPRGTRTTSVRFTGDGL
ncbi:hypothetical protein CC86DRAFT_290339, partial [Ophiobolus disseminans]